MNNLTAEKYSPAEQKLRDEETTVEHYQKMVNDFNEGLDFFEGRHPEIVAEFQFRFDPMKGGKRRLSMVRVTKTLFERDVDAEQMLAQFDPEKAGISLPK